MLSVQHVMCLYEKNMQSSNRLVAATVYPDAVRAYTGARQYSHFERAYDNSDVSYMRFSSDMAITQDEMKVKLLTKCHLVNNIKACAIGEDTDIDAFYKHNARLEYVMKAGIGYHLQQDIVFDNFIRTEIDCSKKYDDIFVFNNKTMNGKELRTLIADIEQHGIYIMAYRLYKKWDMTVNQAWLERNIRPILENEYCSDLADKTFSYMKIREDVDELISRHDWSKLNSGVLLLSKYDKLYDDVQKSMVVR